MLWTKYLIPTSKEVPADAVVTSHKLMIRAGLVRQVAAGAYSYLPLGYRTLRKVEEILREELAKADCLELHLPAMSPIELWEQTNRVEAMGDTLVQLQDKPFRKGTVLGPTHEEIITEHARAYLKSYKQLPVTLYQIQTKFRDEERPKSGVLRTREFLMKDAYSFHDSKESLDEVYDKMYACYESIFTRCGMPYIAVEADSGPIGGDASHEFMVRTDAGEDYLVRTEDGSYAANVERAVMAPVEDEGCDAMNEMEDVHTPGHSTIEQVTEFIGIKPQQLIKTIIYVTDEDKPLVALVRGDHEVNDAKLRKIAGVKTLELASPKVIEELTGAIVGFAGPVALNARIIADQAVTVMHNAVTGANRTDYHIKGVNPGRDFAIKESGDIRFVVDGDKSEDGKPLIFEKCIEVGHVFKLGTKYSAAMGATFAAENGETHPLIMGCYGIGLNRIMAAAVEAHSDDSGIIWPITIAPFHVLIAALDVADEEVMKIAMQLHDQLEAAGVEVLLDDRDARAGFKFKDADLIGIPLRITVGKKGLKEGKVEFKRRDSDEKSLLDPNEVIKVIKAEMEKG